MVSPENQQAVYPRNSVIHKGNFAITSKDPYPEATMRWVDFFWTFEGGVLNQYGVLPQANTTSFDGNNVVKPEVYQKLNISKNEYDQKYLTVWGGPVYLGKEFNDKVVKEPHVQHFNERAVKMFDPVAKMPFPDASFTQEEINQLQALSNDIDSYVKEMEAKFITGTTPLQGWDNYVKDLKSMNVDQYVKVYDEAYKRYKSLVK